MARRGATAPAPTPAAKPKAARRGAPAEPRAAGAGSRHVTIRDVARKAGTSLGTASRVINRAPSVDPAIRIRVEAAIHDLGYRPNTLAQSMRTGTTRTVGILVRDITSPALAGFVVAAQEVLQEADYSLVLACSGERSDLERAFLSFAAGQRVDGLIMTTNSEHDIDLLQARAALNLPIVLFDREIPKTSDAILIAHDQGVRQAVEYLFSQGHRRIALLTGGAAVYPARSRLQGYERAFQEAGFAVDPAMVRAQSFSEDAAFLHTSMLLSLPEPPTAIIAGGISMLPGALRAIRNRGLRIPEDISLVGSGDSDLALLATPAIAVIRWNYAELGRIGARLLLDRLGGAQPDAPRRIIVAAEFVIRESCGPAPRIP